MSNLLEVKTVDTMGRIRIRKLIREGAKFGRLTATKLLTHTRNGYQWECLCDCGNKLKVRQFSLTSGTTESCGCLKMDTTIALGKSNRTHGLRHTAEYNVWIAMRDRCLNQKDEAYYNYGGRGIRVCDEWLTDFQAFYDYMGPRPSNRHSIDRINNDGHYEPGNVRWASPIEQGNNKRNNRAITIDGITKNLAEWAREYGISASRIQRRIDKSGWDPKTAVTKPVR